MSETVKVQVSIPKTRRLKVGHNISPTDGRKVAAIRFSGSYLEQVGFENGAYFDLTIDPDGGSITLRPVSLEEYQRDKGLEKAARHNGKPAA